MRKYHENYILILIIGLIISSILLTSNKTVNDGNNRIISNPKILLISSHIDHANLLAEAASEDIIVVRYDPKTTSLNEVVMMVNNSLNGKKASSICIATHDLGENKFHLISSETVSLRSTLSSSEQRAFWNQMGGMLKEGGRIDILSCKLAMGDNGSMLISSLESASSKNVAASTDITGNPIAGGNWILETDDIDIAKEYFSAEMLNKYSGILWSKEQKLIASDAEADDYFGYSVSISGNYAIIGAIFESDSGNSAGAAYIFKNNSGTWTEQTKLIASDTETSDYFGVSVSISDDHAIVGANQEDAGGTNAGAAYIFVNDSGTWTEQAKLVASDAEDVDRFGHSVSISGDYAIIGAFTKNDSGYNTGAAYIFKNNSGTWTEQVKLLASDATGDDYFGESVSISNNYAIVGAKQKDNELDDAGAAYIFKNNSGTWTEQTKLIASDTETSDHFGSSVSISGDHAIVGANQEDTGGANAGAAYIFVNNSGTWTEQIKLVASDAEDFDRFGHSVSISGDSVIVGASGESYGGAAYIFVNDSGTWTEQIKLVASDTWDGDNFGISVSISDDYAIIGASGSGNDVGAAYIFGESEVAIDEDATLPKFFGLHPAFPNPFNPSITLNYGLAKNAYTTLQIYDIRGQLVETLESGMLIAGNHSIIWQPKNISTGMYIVRLNSNNHTSMQKVVYVK